VEVDKKGIIVVDEVVMDLNFQKINTNYILK
jgi:hypothetical protein